MRQPSHQQRKWRRHYLGVLGAAFVFFMGLVYTVDDGLRLPRGGRRLDAAVAILQYSTQQSTRTEAVAARAEFSEAARPSLPSSKPPPPALLNSTLALDDYPLHVLDVFDAAQYQVRGPAFNNDLERAVLVAGQLSYLDLKAVAGQNATQSFWGKAEYAYATFESGDTAFGAVSGYIHNIQHSRSTLRIPFTPPSAGNYTLTVDLMARDAFYPVYHRRYMTVEVLPAEEPEAGNVPPPAATVPHCEGLPDRGQWARCTAAGLAHPFECLRMGHTFRPLTASGASCYYENWRTEDLWQYATAMPAFPNEEEEEEEEQQQQQRRLRRGPFETNMKQHGQEAGSTAPEKHWIVFAGTSRLRGVFLSAVDHLLGGEPGEFAIINKCWGRMDVTLGNIRLTYQDFRALTVAPWPLRMPDEPRTFQCHDTKQATLDGMEFYHNATQFITHIFKPRHKEAAFRQPTSFLFEKVLNVDAELYHDMIFQHLPRDWSGTAIAILFRSMLSATRTLDKPMLTPEEKGAWVSAIGWPATEVVDTKDIIVPWLRSAEHGAGKASHHWHACTDASAEESSMPFAVKGLVTDVLAQMVFNRVLGPKRDTVTGARDQGSSNAGAEIDKKRPPFRVCTDCPKSLMPFSLKPKSDMSGSCYDHVPRTTSRRQYAREVPDCPTWCMAQPPASLTQTQSKPVEVRECVEDQKVSETE